MQPHPRTSRLAAVLVAATIAATCAHPSNIKTPEGQVAYHANEVAVRVNQAQAAAIEAERTGGLSTDVAREIVKACVSINEVLKVTPQGWQTTVRTSWAEMKFHIGRVENASVSAALAIVDALLEALLI